MMRLKKNSILGAPGTECTLNSKTIFIARESHKNGIRLPGFFLIRFKFLIIFLPTQVGRKTNNHNVRQITPGRLDSKHS